MKLSRKNDLKLGLTVVVLVVVSVGSCVGTVFYVASHTEPISGFGFKVQVDCDTGAMVISRQVVETNMQPLFLVFMIAFFLALVLWILVILAVKRWPALVEVGG